jgi:Flp pilus assembly protein TadG
MRASARVDRRATTSLEFAVTIPALLLCVMGIIEFGRLAWAREALQQVAFSAARCMGVLSSTCASGGVVSTSSTDTYIQAAGNAWSIYIPTSAIALNANTTCGNVAGFSQVTLTYTFNTTVPKLIPSLAQGITLTAKACYPNQPS